MADSISFEDHKQILDAAEERIAELEAQLAEAGKRIKELEAGHAEAVRIRHHWQKESVRIADERDQARAQLAEAQKVSGNTSDGYHTFDELYQFRMLYNAHLFNAWYEQEKHAVHKSVHHSDGEKCFGGGWFIVVATLPTGQISNHYPLKFWSLFKIPNRALPADYDGHTSQDVAERMEKALAGGEEK